MGRERWPGWMSAALCLVTLGLAGCGGGVRAPVSQRATPAEPAAVVTSAERKRHGGTYEVRRGDTLFSIAWAYGLDYRRLAAINRISAPYTIYPGQRLRLEGPVLKARPRAGEPHGRPQPAQAPTPQHSGGAARAGAAPAHGAPDRRREQAASRVEHPAAHPGRLDWVWPARGPLLRRFDRDAPGKKGIAIGGARGTEIRAAAPGEVVYSGSGLVGYGRLIIIKHDNHYLSAYGHNQRILVHEGDRVHGGQVIGYMGDTGTDRVMLHFEIRRDGRPVDPLSRLPGS